MHEWALAELVKEKIELVSKKENFTVLNRIKIRLGALQNINKDIFIESLKTLFCEENKNLFKEVDIEVEEEQAVFRCNKCNREWSYPLHEVSDRDRENMHFFPELASIYIKCPFCLSIDFEVIKGRSFVIEYIEGE